MNRAVRILFLAFFICIGSFVSAQEYMVKSLEIAVNDIDARVNARIGNNGRKCALLKVYVQDDIDHVNGSVVGEIETKGMEKRIYMAHDSKQVELVFKNHFPLHIKFDDYQIPVITEQTVYVIKLIEANSDHPHTGDSTAANEVDNAADILKEAVSDYDEGYYDKAHNLFLKISHDKEAQYYLGLMYYNADGVTRDYAEAARWYRMSAEQGYAGAQCNLGDMYDDGKGVSQDYAEALSWYRKSADQGYARAQCILGFMYRNGNGVKKDDEEAARWYRKSAEQGYAIAQCILGFMYEYGEGVKQDYAEAVRWYRKSADQGDAYAQCYLGQMYENGKGVTQDYTEAARWYRMSAEQGYARAKERLKNFGK